MATVDLDIAVEILAISMTGRSSGRYWKSWKIPIDPRGEKGSIGIQNFSSIICEFIND